MYKKVANIVFTILILMHLLSCGPRHSVLNLKDVSRYDSLAADNIFFLEFRVGYSKNGKKETISLISAVAGNGKMKNLRRLVESPYKIEVVPRYKSSAVGMAMEFEHPLFREAEVPDPSGTITRKKQFAREGTFTMRFQDDHNIEKFDFYSVKPAQDPVKIYTLILKK
jgi:hypothetical protein